jgi:thioredoxin-like negative regulator of GroEL
MTLSRIAIMFGLLLVAQGGVFVWRFADLIYLRQPVEDVAGNREAFHVHAIDALGRTQLTRQHLDTLADAAARLGDVRIEAAALERRLEKNPDDVRIKLRLADALRRAGEFDRAATLFNDVLLHATGDAR